MSIYQPIPTYYRVTWTANSPTDYTGTGGVTPFGSVQMNNTVAITSTASNPTMTNGDIIMCNDTMIGPFTGSSGLSDVINAFNAMTQFTGVMASQDFTGYLTLQSIDPVSAFISLSNFSGTPLTTLGLPDGGYGLGNPIYGGSFSSPNNNDNVVINGTTVTFVTGSLTIAGVIRTINSYTASTNVAAIQFGNRIQLNSLDGDPIYFGAGSSGTSAAIGFADNTAYGGNMTLAQAVAIDQGRLRWKGMVDTVETTLTPVYWDSIAMTGSTTDGDSLPTTLSWTIGVSHPEQLVTATLAGEPETVGTMLYGTAALTRMLARALTGTWSENRKVYNNTLTVRGAYALRENPIIIQFVTAGPLDTPANIHKIEGNLDVELIPNT